MPIPFKTEAENFNQRELYPSNIFDLLPEDHDCFLFRDLFQQLDTSALEASYSPIGQHAYHPRHIVGILIYGYTHGVFSSRQLEKRCNEDLSFMYIAGRNCPNFRVLSDFRKNNEAFFQACFKQTVRLAMELKLASLGHVSLDGTKLKANTSKHKAMSYGHLKQREQELSEQIAALIQQAANSDAEDDACYQETNGCSLPDELRFKQQRLEKIQAAKAALEARERQTNPDKPIEDKAQISFADTEARIMGKRGEGFDYQYNAQASVDSEHQIIIAQHISQQVNDKREVAPALEQIQETTGQLPDKMSLDNGYASGDNLAALEDTEIDAYVAMGRGEASSEELENSQRKLVKSDFEYDEQHDQYHCPQGQVLPVKTTKKDGEKVYQGDASVCAECPYQPRCCQSTKGAARTIRRDAHEPQRENMHTKMAEPEAKATYAARKTIVEPVFGQLKNSGFRGFNVRGKNKVAGEFALLCAGHNIKKIVKAMITGVIRPEGGKWAVLGG